MTYKEQKTGKKKGFQEKWSRKVYQVMGKTAMRRNPGVYKYSIGASQTYFRHELLKIPKKVDTEVKRFPHSEKLVVEDNYEPSN